MKKIETLDIKKQKTISHTKRNKIKNNTNNEANGKNSNEKQKEKCKKLKDLHTSNYPMDKLDQWINSYVHAINYINIKKNMFINLS